MTLDSLTAGTHAIITEIAGTDAVSTRLMERGVLPGVEIELIGRAPLGDPLEFAVAGGRLSLRAAEAARVAIRTPESP